MSSWVRLHFAHLRRWREYAEAIAKATCDLVRGARVYVVGSVARGRYTVLSDIDILIVVPKGTPRKGLAKEIMLRAMDLYGLLWDAPVELHVVEEGEEEPYLRDGHITIRYCTEPEHTGSTTSTDAPNTPPKPSSQHAQPTSQA